MSKIESTKSYTGHDLEQVFFRPLLTGPDAQKLGIRMLYNMPVPTTLHFWKRGADVLQKFTSAGWSGSAKAERFQKTIQMQQVKAEQAYSAADYFGRVWEKIAAGSDVNFQDLSGTQLEEAETALFKEAIAESIRRTMWLGDVDRADGPYTTFDGLLKRLLKDGEATDKTYRIALPDPADDAIEKLLRSVWNNASPQLKAAKSEGQLVYLVSSDIYDRYEDYLDSAPNDSAYLSRQTGRDGVAFRGIELVDLKLGADIPADLPASLVILTDRRNLAMAVNTADFPGSEVRMWYNPDQMENRQRAVFAVGCDYLLPELVSIAIPGTEPALGRIGSISTTGGQVTFSATSNASLIEKVVVTPLNAAGNPAGAEVEMTRNTPSDYTASLSGSSIDRICFNVVYLNGMIHEHIMPRS